jgi:hypothetical protein
VVFFLTESIHYGDLPVDPPRFQLYVDELGPFDAVEALLINPDPHHRTHRLAFRAPAGGLIDPDTVQVVLSAVGGTRPLVLAWDLHAGYDGPTPLNLASAEVVRVSVTPYGFVPGVLEFAVGRPVIVVFDNPTDHEHHFHAEYLPIGDSLRWLVVPDGRELTDDALRGAAQFTTHICESEFGYCPTGAWVHLHANPGGQDAIAFIPRTPGIFGVSCPIHPDVAGNIVVRSSGTRTERRRPARARPHLGRTEGAMASARPASRHDGALARTCPPRLDVPSSLHPMTPAATLPRPSVALHRLLRDVVAGTVVGALMVVTSVSMAALVFTGELEAFRGNGIGLALIGTALTGLVVTLLSSLRGTTAQVQDAPAAILAVVVAAMVATLPAGADRRSRAS